MKDNNVKYIGISLECSIKDLENLSFKDNIICYLYGRPKVMILKAHPFLQDGDILKNINNKEKIYHLPFDQQYDRTIIGDQKGEFFAWTVQEAVDKGFRRAKKYFYVKQ